MNASVRTRSGLLVPLCAAFALRLYHLDAHGLWYDEAFTSWIVAKDWAGILEFARAPKLEHPPVYYFLLHGWTLLAGDSEFALRFFSVCFSVLAVALLFRFARRWFSASLANWTLILAALSPFLVVYAQEARMYTLVLCASLLALDYFLRWLDGERNAWALYVCFTLLSLSIHYYAALLLLVENVYLLIVRVAVALPRGGGSTTPAPTLKPRGSQWPVWNALLGALTLGVIIAAPGPRDTLALVFGHPLFAGRSADELRRILVDLFIGGVVIRPLALADLWSSAALLIVAALGIVVLWRSRRDNPRVLMLCLLLLVPPIAAAAVPLIYAARYLFLVVPALIVLSAAALASLSPARRVSPRPRRPLRRMAFALALLVVLVASGYGFAFNYDFVKSPYREMATVVSRAARTDDGVILDGPSQWPQAFYYLRGRWAQAFIPSDPEAAELSDIDAPMRAMQQAHPRLWVLAAQSAVVDPGNNVTRWLSLNAYPVSIHWFKNGDAVALYHSGNTLSPAQMWNAQFGEWLVLEQSALSAPTVIAGEALAVELRWHARKPIPQSVQLLVTLRLLDAQGRIVQERVTKPCDGFCPIDDWVIGEPMADRHGLVVPSDAPPGDYMLRLELFAPRQGQSLAINGVSVNTSLELARIHVTGDK